MQPRHAMPAKPATPATPATPPPTTRRVFLGSSLAAAGVVVCPAWLPAANAGPPSGAGSDSGTGSDATAEALLAAVVAGHAEPVRRLLAARPNLASAHDADGRSAFALALLHRHPNVATILREHGYAPDLHEAALALDWPRFDELAAPDPLSVNGNHPIGGSAMLAAATGGAGSDMWRVYRYAGDPNGRPGGATAHTPLRAALEFPNLPTAELTAAALLSNGADPNLPEHDGRSPLHVAASRGSTEIVEMLIRTGADVHATDANGDRAIALAERAGHEVVADLLRHDSRIPRDHTSSRRAFDAGGAPYVTPDFAGLSIIELGHIVGQSHRDLDGVRAALARDRRLAHGVATTTEGAVEAGAHMGNVAIVDLLLEHGAPCSLPTACMRNDLARVRALLRGDPLRIHERGAHGFALLWYPVIGGGLLEMAELLLHAGAEVERQHHLGTTALHWAAMRGQIDLARLFIEHGADVNRRGRKFRPAGHTPLEHAIAHDHDDVARLLRDHGARA